MPLSYPFSAVLGCDLDGVRPDGTTGLDDMGLALVLTTVSPGIGGVLLRGEKGTAKSTVVRALADVLPPVRVVAGDRFSSDPDEAAPLSPDAPFPADAGVESRPVRLVELPVGATEDRVLGSIHLEKALGSGEVAYEPGLLARAHRGILYVDEVNLLHDHLVDVLLDAAAMGRVTVERDNVSVTHAASFVLIGTMNPEEGELRPQLLDRFGLTVEVAAPRDPRARAEVVRRRLAFDAAPAAFCATYEDAEARLRARIVEARALVPHVQLSESALLRIAELCAAFDVDGLRADIVTARTAVAHAAWQGRDRVRLDDIRAAARLTLPHRRRRNPFDQPGLDEELLDSVLGDDDLDPDPDPGGGPEPDGGPEGGPDADPDRGPQDGPDAHGTDGAPDPSGAEAAEDDEVPAPAGSAADSAGDPADSTENPADSARKPADSAGIPDTSAGQAATPASGEAYRTKLFSVRGLGAGEAGRRSRAVTTTGRRTGAERPGPGGTGLHLLETVRAAAPHQLARGRSAGPLRLRGEDLRVARREGHEANLVLFCVDASGSMAARKRMGQVKTAVLSLLLDAYRRRDKVGLVTFRGTGAEVALPPTHSVDVAARRLEELPAGGRTPLAEGLLEAGTLLERERLRDPRRRPLLVLVTDGRATAGADAVERSRRAAGWLAERDVAAVVVDCESGPVRMGLARELAARLGAEHVPVDEVSADVLTSTVKARVA